MTDVIIRAHKIKKEEDDQLLASFKNGELSHITMTTTSETTSMDIGKHMNKTDYSFLCNLI